MKQRKKKRLTGRSRYTNLIIGGVIVGGLILLAVFANAIAPNGYDEAFMDHAMEAPSAKFLFGTDSFGRDVFSRVVYGTRIALRIALLSVSIQLVLGLTVGLVCGYFGGWIDRLLCFVMDVFWSIPGLIMSFAFITILGKSLTNAIIAVALVGWVQYARIVRTQTMSVKNRAFIETGIAFGESTPALLIRYILPNIIPSLVVVASMSIPSAITSTTVLSFLGLGATAPSPDWGLALSENISRFTYAPWLSIYPGLALVLTTLGFTMLGEGLRDIIDPRLKV